MKAMNVGLLLLLSFLISCNAFSVRSIAPRKSPLPSLEEYIAKREATRKYNPTSDEMWPLPASAVKGSGISTLVPNNFKFVAGGQSGPILTAAFQRYLKLTFPWNASISSTNASPQITMLKATITSPYSEVLKRGTDESYTLVVSTSSSTVLLSASTVFGILRGLETFSQIVFYDLDSQQYFVYDYIVKDSPRLPVRGVMLDTARRFLTISSLKAIVDSMSYYKLNTLHLHLIDTDSWPMEIPSYPKLTNAAYSPYYHIYPLAEMKTVVQYALERGIRVIPEIDTPGHSFPICYVYPDFCVLYESNGKIYRGVLPDPTNESTWDFFKSLWKDLTSAFVSDEFHIGGEEVDLSQWESAPTVQAFMKKNNYTNVGQVFNYYVRRHIEILRSLQKGIIGWFPGIEGYPLNFNGSYVDYPDVSLMEWYGWFSPWQDLAASATSQQANLLLAGPYYVVEPRRGNSATWQQMYQTDPRNFTGTAKQKSLMQGGMLTSWDDATVSDSGNILVALSPYLGFVAENWWSPADTTADVDWARFNVHRCRCILRGVASNPLSGDDIHSLHCPKEFDWSYFG